MGGLNKGKAFEEKFREDWKHSFPSSFIYRLPDQMSEYRGSVNPCDFICFVKPYLFLIETKVHQGNTLPWSAFIQYERLLQYKNISGIHPGVVIWFEDHDKVVWYNIKDVEQMHIDGKKSIRFDDETLYNGLVIPSVKKRVFMESDYNILIDQTRRLE